MDPDQTRIRPEDARRACDVLELIAWATWLFLVGTCVRLIWLALHP